MVLEEDVHTPWLAFLALPSTIKLYLTGGNDSFSGTFFYLLLPCAVVGFIALSSILSAIPAFRALLHLAYRLKLHTRAASAVAFAVGVMLVHDAFARFVLPLEHDWHVPKPSTPLSDMS